MRFTILLVSLFCGTISFAQTLQKDSVQKKELSVNEIPTFGTTKYNSKMPVKRLDADPKVHYHMKIKKEEINKTVAIPNLNSPKISDHTSGNLYTVSPIVKDSIHTMRRKIK